MSESAFSARWCVICLKKQGSYALHARSSWKGNVTCTDVSWLRTSVGLDCMWMGSCDAALKIISPAEVKCQSWNPTEAYLAISNEGEMPLFTKECFWQQCVSGSGQSSPGWFLSLFSSGKCSLHRLGAFNCSLVELIEYFSGYTHVSCPFMLCIN